MSVAKDICLGGIQKCSLIDFPGKVSCVVFVTGCNFRCPYCHNPELVKNNGSPHRRLDNNIILNFLKQRQGLLDGVVISGGEPTLQPGLFAFCQKLKELGYAVKLDTNGTRPEVIEKLLKAKLVDYVAMDIKADLSGYQVFTGREFASRTISKSIKIIMEQAPAYEFRTTCVKPFIDKAKIYNIAWMIKGAMMYALQRFHQTKVLSPEFFKNNDNTYTDCELQDLKSMVEPFVQNCIIR